MDPTQDYTKGQADISSRYFSTHPQIIRQRLKNYLEEKKRFEMVKTAFWSSLCSKVASSRPIRTAKCNQRWLPTKCCLPFFQVPPPNTFFVLEPFYKMWSCRLKLDIYVLLYQYIELVLVMVTLSDQKSPEKCTVTMTRCAFGLRPLTPFVHIIWIRS